MLALFDSFDEATRQLTRSLHAAGIPFTPVVITYQGELPDDALCPFVAYTGLPRTGRPLFFNEVPVPPWCEIRHGREEHGEILRDGFLLGRINYEANSFRQVESVDWLLPDGAVSHTDLYDRYGSRYATRYCSNGAAYQTVYSGPGEWTIEVDHATRVIVLRSATRVLAFDSLTQFVSFFIDDQRIPHDSLLINSLSYPLFVARARATHPNTTLFWQEPMPGAVPENMALELELPTALRRIVFFDEALRAKVAAHHPNTAVELAYLSHLDQFAEKRDYDPRRAFILTASDEIPGLVELLEAFPDVTISVAAMTLMSAKLHDLAARYPNLVLTPTINHTGIRTELEQASVYLDINAGPEVLDVVRAAYHLDLVVLALGAQAKAPDFSLTSATVDELKARVDAVTSTRSARSRALDELHTQHGPLSTAEDWRPLFL
ncbi:accessory Sec system glycosylation chaperone GtfB [Gryllotalpicola daejeonensis]|uniref:Accessory Sec system glycosylation chaperone GtfB n=1 Tax=Gryllotalpicola daejeonensis TaxID=993087 RepID=A0ABP7ZG23_9MICO